MTLGDRETEFITANHSAAMITAGADGYPKAARVGVGFVDGRLWSSGTADRVRTRRLRRDPKATLFVFDSAFSFLTLETTVTILDGPDAAQQNLRYFRLLQNKPDGPLSWFGGEYDEQDFLAVMIDEKRLIYEFEVHRTYGLF